MCVRILVYVRTCVNVCMRVTSYVHDINIYLCMHVHAYIYANAQIHTYAKVRTYICMHARMYHTHMHTHSVMIFIPMF